MKKYNSDEIIEIFEKSCRIIYDCTLSGEYKMTNKEAKRLISLFKKFEKEPELAHKCIDKLLSSNNVVARTKAAAYCLALDYKIDVAVNVLYEISQNVDNGIFGFNADMTLKVWKQQGYIKIYQ